MRNGKSTTCTVGFRHYKSLNYFLGQTISIWTSRDHTLGVRFAVCVHTHFNVKTCSKTYCLHVKPFSLNMKKSKTTNIIQIFIPCPCDCHITNCDNWSQIFHYRFRVTICGLPRNQVLTFARSLPYILRITFAWQFTQIFRFAFSSG